MLVRPMPSQARCARTASVTFFSFVRSRAAHCREGGSTRDLALWSAVRSETACALIRQPPSLQRLTRMAGHTLSTSVCIGVRAA